MREIKFRAWDKHKEEMITDGIEYELRLLLHYPTNQEFKPPGNIGYNAYDYEHFIIMQYTGLKDKNGKEIYEGDIVKANHPNDIPYWIGEVSWEDDLSMFVLNSAVYVGTPFCEYDEIKVIGNIHENPELLKGE